MVYINGEFKINGEAALSVYDHGLLYGDGVFEGIRFYNYTPFLMKEHIQRLYNSCRAIRLEVPHTKEELTELCTETISKSELKDGYIRLLITRGIGNLGINPFLCSSAGVVIIVDKIQLYPKEYYDKGIAIITSSFRRTPLDCLDTRIKSLNYLNNVQAKGEAVSAGFLEAILLNQHGRIAECTGDNIFIVKDGTCITPLVTEGALNGMTRNFILKNSAGIETGEGMLSLYDIYTADECFLTGTAAEIIPVVEADRRKIGNGKPGPVTKRLAEYYKKAANG